jgi:hypothetical protein
MLPPRQTIGAAYILAASQLLSQTGHNAKAQVDGSR